MRLLLVLALTAGVDARVVTGAARLTGEFTEHDIVKFAYRVGKGKFKLTAWIDEGAEYASDELSAYAYLDDEWAAVTKATTCDEKVKLARWSARVMLRDETDEGDDGFKPSKYGKRWAHSRTISSSIRTHVWYFTLADCSLERYLHAVPDVHYRAELLDGDSQLPIDEEGLKPMHRVNFLAASLLALWLARRAKRSASGKKGGALTVHAAEVGLFLAAACDAASSFCELAHIAKYERDGVGSYAMDAFSAYFEATCDAVLALLTLCIAGGWTLSSHLGDDEKAGRHPLRDETLPERAASAAAPLADALRRPLKNRTPAAMAALVFVGAHVALAQWSRIYDDDFDSFHDFEHAPGRVVVWLRVVLAAIFVPVALRTQACAGARLRRFYVRRGAGAHQTSRRLRDAAGSRTSRRLPGQPLDDIRVSQWLNVLSEVRRRSSRAGRPLGRVRRRRFKRAQVWWALVGAAWLLSLPIVTAIASVCPGYTRHRVVVVVTALVQTAALGVFAALFAGKAARAFHEASTVGDGDADLGAGRGGLSSGPKLRVAGVKVRVD